MSQRPPPPRGALDISHIPKASEEPSIVLDTSDTLPSEEAESGWSPVAENDPFSSLKSVEMDSEEKKRALEQLEKAKRALLGDKADEYLKRFANKSIFNVYGFFPGPFWYAHRGMLNLALLDSVCIYSSWALYFISRFFRHGTINPLLFCIWGICGSFSLILRFTGDAFYKNHINKKARELAQLVPDREEWQEYIVRNISKSDKFLVIITLSALIWLPLGFLIYFLYGLTWALAKV